MVANASATANANTAEYMVAAGVHIVPLMPSPDVIALAVEAERLGYDYCMVADEGVHPDIYACLGAAARETERHQADQQNVNKSLHGDSVGPIEPYGKDLQGPMSTRDLRINPSGKHDGNNKTEPLVRRRVST